MTIEKGSPPPEEEPLLEPELLEEVELLEVWLVPEDEELPLGPELLEEDELIPFPGPDEEELGLGIGVMSPSNPLELLFIDPGIKNIFPMRP